MTEMAALQMKVDTSSLVQAANDLDNFSKAATRAGTAGGNQSGSMSKMIAVLSSMDTKLSAVVGNLEKMAAVEAKVAAATKAAANDINSFGGSMNATSMALSTAASKAATVSVTFEQVAKSARDANAHVAAYQANLATMASRQGQSNAHMAAYSKHLQDAADNSKKAATAIKFTAQEGLNASRQLADIGVTAAMGMSPLMIAIQQGPQLFDILQNKAAMTGQTIGTVFRAAAASVLAFMAPLLPIIAAVAALAAGIAALTAQANDDSGLKKYTTAMGYTKDEVKKLNAVTVTFGDTMKAVFQVGWERIANYFGISTDSLGKKWGEFTDWLVTAIRAGLAGVYAAFTGLQNVIPRLLDNIKTGKKENLFELVGGSFADQYKEAQKFMTDVVNQGRENAQKRQADMAKEMYDAPSAKAATKQFGFADLEKEAAMMERELRDAAAAIGLYGEELARVEYEQRLFNKAADEGLKLSTTEAQALEEKAKQLAKLAEANRVAQWREETKKSILDRSEAIKQEAAAVGVQGTALRTLRIEQELLNSARAKNIKLTDNDREKIAQSADILGQQEYNTVTRPKAVDDTARLHAEKMRQLEVEKNAIYLTGQALTEYQYKQELINNQIQAGVAIKDIDISKIDAQAAAYSKVSEAIEKQKQQLADAKEVVGGFFTDMMNGARNGQSALKAFGDAAVNALNRIIDKLMNKFLDQFLSGLLGGMSSGGISAANKTVNATVANNASIFAKGGSFGHAQPFAKGGTFTNSVVSKATPFMFADGGSFGASLGVMGEKTPEAVMPLKRGANGSLGVQVHGGNAKPSVRMGDITQVFRIEGAMTSEDVIGMVRQGSAAAVEQTRRDLQSMLEQLDADGKLQ